MRALDLPNRPWIVGHRGAAGEKLENTLASVERAIAAGVDMIEVDIQLTSDDRLVVFHDESLERLVGDRRRVGRLSWRALERIELRGPGRAETRRIPRLAELLATTPESTPLNLEAKVHHARAEVFARRVLEEVGDRRQILLSSFDWKVLAAVRALDRGLPLAPISHADREGLLGAADELEAWSLGCHHSLATRRLLDAPRRRSRPVLAYTVNRPRRARTLLRRGVAGVFTDYPTRMLGALERWPV